MHSHSSVAPKLVVLGQARTLLSTQPSTPTIALTSLQRRQNISKLVRHFPEFAPASELLPLELETFGVNKEIHTDQDQTLSERVAFGQALHPGRHRNSPRTVPVVAFVGGLAGDLIRVVQLTPETIGLDADIHLEFQGQSFQSRVQGLWHTSRGPIQQLQFANSDHEPTEWLAVRHGGATSILRIILRENEVPTLYRIPHVPLFGPEVEIRIELEHVTVLPVQSLGDALHTDICFNPWQVSEIAVLDQSSRWKVWTIRSVNKHTKVWTSEARCSGHLMEEAPDDASYTAEKTGIKRYDGWGAVRFVGNGDYLLVCNREQTAYFNLRGQPASSQGPELGLKKGADWILNVSHVSTLSDYISMITSSRILWIHLALDFERTEQPQLIARSLLAWRHFSSMEDLSLSSQIVSLPPSTLDLQMLFVFLLLNPKQIS